MKQLRILVEVRNCVESRAIDGWDVALWSETFGDLSLMSAMVDRLETSFADDLAQLRHTQHGRDAAQHVHRIVGGMRIFGESPEASAAEAWERALISDDDATALSRLPLFESAIARFVARLRRGVADLT